MIEYVKLRITLKERFLFLFTGLIRRNYIISKRIESVAQGQTEIVASEDTEIIEKIETIPFFDLDKSDTKSNL